uniref:RGS domain-containing protein n=1 Tax=Schistocephalus solidus TaxID=70667 RepID=A0A183TL03_SCHSO
LSGDDVERAFTFFLSNTQFLRGKEAAAKISKHQRLTSRQLNYFYVGYRQLADLELNIYTVENPPPRPYPFQDQINVTLELRSFLSSCAFLQSGSISWETYGCNAIEKDMGEYLPGDVEQRDSRVAVAELVVSLLRVEMYDCGVFEILRDLSLVPHRLEQRCELVHHLGPPCLQISAGIASDPGAFQLKSCSTALMVSWR